MFVAGQRSACDRDDKRQFILLQKAHDRPTAEAKEPRRLGRREPKGRAPFGETGPRHRRLLLRDSLERRGRDIEPAPLGLDRPSEAETVFHDRRFGDDAASSTRGAKCTLRAISPVRSSLRSFLSPAKRTCSTWPPARTRLRHLLTSSLMRITSGTRPTPPFLPQGFAPRWRLADAGNARDRRGAVAGGKSWA
jgi:hypothetical protein